MKKEKKEKLLVSLDTAIRQAAAKAISKSEPIGDKNSCIVGSLSVKKNDSGLFEVLNVNKEVLHTNISLYYVAVLVAQKFIAGHRTQIKEILELENSYQKFHNDMLHYLHCYKVAKTRNDTGRMSILEDKFQMSEQHAKKIKEKLDFYKRSKSLT